MRLERLELENFRSYRTRTFHFGDLTILFGPNGVGKTNVVEAINLLSTGTSFRASVIEEMVALTKEFGRVTAIVENEGERESLGVVVTRGKIMGKRTQKRRYLVDGVARTRAKFLGRLVTVTFRPEDLRLIEGSPTRRRAFVNEVLSSASGEYDRALTAYDSSLRRRNRLLEGIREGVARREQLAFWSATLIKNGNILTEKRRELMEDLSGRTTSFGEYRLQYLASTISETRLKEYEVQEVAAGHTLVGPHKDDFLVFSQKQGGKDMMKYGSRGEQRLSVLFMKLGVLGYLEDQLKVKPILLLDDIFSELDADHRQQVIMMTQDRQTIITTAELEVAELFEGAQVVTLSK